MMDPAASLRRCGNRHAAYSTGSNDCRPAATLGAYLASLVGRKRRTSQEGPGVLQKPLVALTVPSVALTGR